MLLVAFALRVVALDRFPPGLYHDEAYYGLDAVGVLEGNLHVYFPANNGREPLFIYLASVAIAILGPTALALRLTAAYVGTLTIAASYALGAQLFDRRVGLAAAAWMAVTLWPVWLSRTGFRAGTLPCVLALAVAATAYAVRRNPSRRWLLVSGFLAGLTMYTYTAARVLPLFGLCFALVLLWRRRLPFDLLRPWLAAAGVTLLPLVIHFARVPADILGRAEQVMVGGGAAGNGGLEGKASLVWHNVQAVVGMLFGQGDSIPRHNLGGHSVFWPFSAPAVFVGVIILIAGLRGKRANAHLFILLWFAFMSLPTILAEDAPHYLRAVGLLPAIMLLPALTTKVRIPTAHRLVRSIPAVLVWIGIAFELYLTEAIPRIWAPNFAVPPTWQFRNWSTVAIRWAFEDAAAVLAAEIRGGLEAGYPVWLDRRLRDGWPLCRIWLPWTESPLSMLTILSSSPFQVWPS